MKTKRKKRRWAVMFPNKAQYIGGGDGIQWTTCLDEAKRWALRFNGIVVDADWLSTGWAEWQSTGVIPAEARP